MCTELPSLPLAWAHASQAPARATSPAAIVSAASGVTHAASYDQALRYLRHNAPVCIEGNGGSVVCMQVVGRIRRYGVATAGDWIELADSSGWNARCRGPWSERELVHKYTSSLARIGDPPRATRPHLYGLDVVRAARAGGRHG